MCARPTALQYYIIILYYYNILLLLLSPVHVAHGVDVREADGALARHAPGGGGPERGVVLGVEVEDGAVVAHLGQQLRVIMY